MKSTSKNKERLKYRVVDPTGMLVESTPIFAAFENGIVGYTNAVSRNVRLFAAGAAYLGLGKLLTKGREYSRERFNITEDSLERVQHIHDALYTGVFNLLISPPMYTISQILEGQTIDFKKMKVATGLAIATGILNGGPMGYVIDIFRDFTGVEENNRLPNSLGGLANTAKKAYFWTPTSGRFFDYVLRKAENAADFTRSLKPRTKKGLAVLLTAGSLALTAGIYSVIPDKPEETNPSQQGIEQIVENFNQQPSSH